LLKQAEMTGDPLLASVAPVVEAWQEHGTQIRLREVKLLQVRDPVGLDRLRAAPWGSRWVPWR